MTDLHQPEDINEESLNSLIRGITRFPGEFSLILAHCNYAALQERIAQQLREQCTVEIRELVLEPSVETLYTTIAKELGQEQPDALMVLGLESVIALEQVLKATNQIREEFRNFAFPLVLWVTDEVQQKLIRLVPDFYSWATTVEFEMATDELIDFIRQTADEVFAQVLDSRENIFLDNAVFNLEFSSFRRTELQSANQELKNRGIKLDPELEAGWEFMLGRIADNSKEESRGHYERSLALWQRTDNRERCGYLLFYLGLWWRNYAVRHRPEYENACERAKDYFGQCVDVFEQAKRPDLVAKFINPLAEVLHRLKQWDELERVANKAKALHETHSDEFRQARVYGFLAEVALSKSASTEAQQSAQQALSLLKSAQKAIATPSLEQWAFLDWVDSFHQGWYLFSLAKAQQNLKRGQEAIATLKAAKEIAKPQYDPELYIGILGALREGYFQQGEYLTAFEIKQKQQAIESQFNFRAFIGAGRLQPKQQVTNPALPSMESEKTLALEFAASGREQDIKRLVGRMYRDDMQLTVIYGQSGVGKSSIIEAGLVPALKREIIDTRRVLPVLQRVYGDWVGELGRVGEWERGRWGDGERGGQGDKERESVEFILGKLKENSERNLLTVLIFDQFEEFFFDCQEPSQRKVFYDFLQQCLELPYVKVILSLREDYLHYLLECNRLTNLEAINNNILDKNILYYLGNFTTDDAKSVIGGLTKHTQFSLKPALIDKLVQDLAAGIGEIRPIELQVVGAQLQREKIGTLEQYQESGTKKELVKRYLAAVVEDCGKGNERVAQLILYLLTDEKNTRPLKTEEELVAGLAGLDVGTKAEQLDLVFKILVGSGLVFLVPAPTADQYQLVHDYLAAFIRKQQEEGLVAELRKAKEDKRTQAKLNRLLKLAFASSIAAGLVLTVVAGVAVVFALKSRKQEKMAVARQLAATSEWIRSQRENLHESSVLLAVESMKRFQKMKEPSMEADRALRNGLTLLSPFVSRISHEADVLAVAFSPDGKYLASASGDSAWLYFAKPQDLIAEACRRLSRNLTANEWEQYMDAQLHLYDKPCEKEQQQHPIHPSFLQEGIKLAREGNVKAASVIFRRAKYLDPEIDLNPDTEEVDKDPKTIAQQLAAPAKVKEGEKLAKKGKVKEAISAYKEAQKLDPEIDLNPDTEEVDKDPKTVAQQLAAPIKVEEGKRLAKQGKVEEAIAVYQEAQKLDSTLKISADSWNSLCRFGSLNGYPAEVMFACKKAVKLAPKHGGIRDSRGLARALTGNTEGAINDFQTFVDWTYNNKERSQRQGWIDALRAGENPFTPEVIESLK
ncbi:MAG: hypothetical protein AB4426_17925 [Xenococcaceae cyanobacterium]